jgi:hypothetical protein
VPGGVFSLAWWWGGFAERQTVMNFLQWVGPAVVALVGVTQDVTHLVASG